MDLSILIVSHNTRDRTLACLRSIARETRSMSREILLLDNGSRDGTAEVVSAEFPEVRLEARRDNLGFARGVNRLAERAGGERFLLLNPDTEVVDDAIGRLLQEARSHGMPGILGGRTLRPDRGADPGFAWGRPTPWSTFCIASGLAGLFRGSPWLDPEGVGARLPAGEHEVDVVSGCFMLVDRDLWERLGGFDPGFFVYGEDADLCLRARALGVRPRVTTAAAVVHHGGASERSLADKYRKLLAAKKLLMQRHWSPARARLGGVLLAGHALLRAVVLTLLAPLAPRRYAERARGWRTVWRHRGDWLSGVFPDEAGGEPSTPASQAAEEPALR